MIITTDNEVHIDDGRHLAFAFIKCDPGDPREGQILLDAKTNEWQIFFGDKWKPFIRMGDHTDIEIGSGLLKECGGYL